MRHYMDARDADAVKREGEIVKQTAFAMAEVREATSGVGWVLCGPVCLACAYAIVVVHVDCRH